MHAVARRVTPGGTLGRLAHRAPAMFVLAGGHTASPVAALTSEAPPAPAPPTLAPAGDGWSAAEIETVAGLLHAANADAEHWALGDHLAALVPVGIRGRKTGTGRKLAELARLVDVSHRHLRGIRDTARDWPPDTRVSAAPFHVHSAFRDGGRDRAPWRRDRLLEMERHAGKITAKSLRRWRRAQGGEHAPVSTRRRASDSELARRVEELLEDVDRLMREGGPEELLGPVRDDLDALVGHVERLERVLAA
jgi:hypothetical protein